MSIPGRVCEIVAVARFDMSFVAGVAVNFSVLTLGQSRSLASLLLLQRMNSLCIVWSTSVGVLLGIVAPRLLCDCGGPLFALSLP